MTEDMHCDDSPRGRSTEKHHGIWMMATAELQTYQLDRRARIQPKASAKTFEHTSPFNHTCNGDIVPSLSSKTEICAERDGVL